MGADLHLKKFDNEKVGSPKILHKHIGDKNIDVHDGLFNFEKAMKNLANLDNKINMIIDIIKPKQRLNIWQQRRADTILNEIRKSMLDFHVYHDTIFKLIIKYQHQRLDKVLSKYSKRSK